MVKGVIDQGDEELRYKIWAPESIENRVRDQGNFGHEQFNLTEDQL